MAHGHGFALQFAEVSPYSSRSVLPEHVAVSLAHWADAATLDVASVARERRTRLGLVADLRGQLVERGLNVGGKLVLGHWLLSFVAVGAEYYSYRQ